MAIFFFGIKYVKTATVRALIYPDKKERVTEILDRIGINHFKAIHILYSLIEEHKGFPFELKLPETEQEESPSNEKIIAHLKESLKRNRRLGELLAK